MLPESPNLLFYYSFDFKNIYILENSSKAGSP